MSFCGEHGGVVKITKTIKTAGIILMACLALYGTYTLFRKPPQINISAEDRDYLQRMGIDAAEEATSEGLSGVHGIAQGVPSLGISSSSVSSAAVPVGLSGNVPEVLPPFFADNTAQEAAQEFDAPNFVPLVSNVVSETVTAEAPPFDPPVAIPATPAVIIGSPPAVPAPKSEPPVAPPPPIASPPPLSWDGTAADVFIVSSADSPKPAEGFAVTECEPKKTAVPLSDEEQIIKRLPFVAAKTPNIKILSAPEQETANVPPPAQDKEPQRETAVSLPQELTAVPVITADTVGGSRTPQNYQQTSIRNPRRNVVTERIGAEPIVSFGQPQSVKDPMQPKLLPAGQKAADGTAVMPFTESEEILFTSPAGKSSLPGISTPAVRDAVERFVRNQENVAESGETGKIREAFVQLSKFYNEHGELSSAERSLIQPVLDKLALNVIYSRSSHILEPEYTVREGDTTDSIAEAFDLTAAILMKINGLTGARPLEPGTKLKVLIGPFDAKISVQRQELTLVLGGLYAGRFTAALGERVEGLRGEFYIKTKTDTWNEKVLTLNNGVTFCGRDRQQPNDAQETAVRFTKQDAKELFDILSEHSVIVFED
ncbi:MAG: LysM peptidoglycan-binding domain-containing protein [Planctomycetaceae bacterium]|nr:LysM peptidoglycan-binding domain-containing protein [Planctomycetaceae bacterium]